MATTFIPKIRGYHFTDGEIKRTLQLNCRLLQRGSITENVALRAVFIALEPICNFCCPYCYTSAGKNCIYDGLSGTEIIQIINTVRNYGAQSIVIAGEGEPLLSRHIWRIIEYTAEIGMTLVIFTNGSIINKEIAEKLYHHSNVSLILKLNSFRPCIQDFLIGVRRGYKQMYRALDALLATKFRAPRFAVQSVITKINMVDLRELFLFCRKHDIVPYFETYVAMGRGADPLVRSILESNKQEIKEFFAEIQKLDEQLFNIKWELYPRQRVIAYGKCNKNLVMITISSRGDVYRCVTDSEKLGNIREKSLENILSDPSVVSILTKNSCAGCKSVTL